MEVAQRQMRSGHRERTTAMINKHNIVLFVALVWLSAAAVGCGGKSKPEQAAISADTDTTFVDTRDGQTYRKISIGSQVWMAENLKYKAKGSKCYGEEGVVVIGYNPIKTKTLSDEEIRDNCNRYGLLYNWHTAKRACPAGFHLPDTMEMRESVNFGGGDSIAGKKLKSASGWKDNSNGTDDYGFMALPGGGYSGYLNGFVFDGSNGFWWGATEIDATYAYVWEIYYKDEYVGQSGYNNKADMFSVRCVEDATKGNGK